MTETPERPEVEAPVETESELDEDATQEHDTATAAAEDEGGQTSPNRRQGQDDDAAQDAGDAAPAEDG